MKNTSVTCIFLEPPGNIQKELHNIRHIYAQQSRDTTILAFPELIPLMFCPQETVLELSLVEKSLRGKIKILMDFETHEKWKFLPVLLEEIELDKKLSSLSFTTNFYPEIPISWKIGKLSWGTQSNNPEIFDTLKKKPVFAFNSGKLVKANVFFLNALGTDYVIEISECLYRKKLKP